MMFTESSIVCRTHGLIDSNLDNETVILSIENGNYYGLNEIGTRIWTLLQNPISLKEICSILTKEFSVNNEQCIQDVRSFIEHLKANNLVGIST